MIKTILKAGAVTATVAGATFLAGPAYAGPHDDGPGNTTYVLQFGEYIANCGGLPSHSQGLTHCDTTVENGGRGEPQGGPGGPGGPGGWRGGSGGWGGGPGGMMGFGPAFRGGW